MGHSNAQTTLEFYNQVDRDHELKAARVIQRLLDTEKDRPKANEICAQVHLAAISRQSKLNPGEASIYNFITFDTGRYSAYR